MRLKQSNLVIGLGSDNKGIEEGEYKGKIVNVTLKLDQVTPYGFKNILDIEIEKDLLVTRMNKKTSYYVSDNINSRFFIFLNDMKIDTSEEVFDIDTLVGRNVNVTIKNNTVNGTTYSNIERITAI